MDNPRELAMKWWKDLSEDEKIWIMLQLGYEKRHPKSLTGREVEVIWLKYKTT